MLRAPVKVLKAPDPVAQEPRWNGTCTLRWSPAQPREGPAYNTNASATPIVGEAAPAPLPTAYAPAVPSNMNMAARSGPNAVTPATCNTHGSLSDNALARSSASRQSTAQPCAEPASTAPPGTQLHSQRRRNQLPSVQQALAAIDAAAAERSARKLGLPDLSASRVDPSRDSQRLATPQAAADRPSGAWPLADPALAQTLAWLRDAPALAASSGARLDRSIRPQALETSGPWAGAAPPVPEPALASGPHAADGGSCDTAPEPEAAGAQRPFDANGSQIEVEAGIDKALPQLRRDAWGVWLVGCTVLLLGLALELAYMTRVEQTVLASGTLLVRGDPRPVLSQASGAVLSLEVTAGERLQRGQLIARIGMTDLDTREQPDRSQLDPAPHEEPRLGATDAHSSVTTAADALTTCSAERAAWQERSCVRPQIDELASRLTASRPNDESASARLSVQSASSMPSSGQARALQPTTEARAPVAGRIESLLVTRGQAISAGAVLARMVPDGVVMNAVVFAPAEAAPWLREGLKASLEFASLPANRLRIAPARITRVSKNRASAEEIRSVLGRASHEPMVRVELELLPSLQRSRVRDELPRAQRLTARLHTRDKRVIGLLFERLRALVPQ